MTTFLIIIWIVGGIYYNWRSMVEHIDFVKRGWNEINADTMKHPFWVDLIVVIFGVIFLVYDCIKNGFKILNHNKYYLDGEKKHYERSKN